MHRTALLSTGLIATLVVLVLALGIIVINLGAARDTAQLAAQLTAQALATQSPLEGTAISTALPSPPVPTPAVAETATDDFTSTADAGFAMTATLAETATAGSIPTADAGFAMTAALPDHPLIADGHSEILLSVTTTDPTLAGQSLILTVFGGGYVEPPELTLPAPGESAQVRYIAGMAASEIRVEGTIIVDRVERTHSISFLTEQESVALIGRVIPPLDPVQPVVVPIELALQTGDGQPVNGVYQLRVFSNGGAISLTPGDSGVSPIDLILTSDTLATLYFTPTDAREPGRIQAQVLDRNDVEPFEALVYWTNIAQRLEFVPQQNQPVTLWTADSPLCLRAYNSSGRAIRPNLLHVRFETLLPTESEMASDPASGFIAGQTYRFSADQLLFGSTAVDTCLPTSPDSGGLVRLTLWADREDTRTEALALVHFGEIHSWQLATTAEVALPRQDGGMAALAFTPANAPAIYQLQPLDPGSLLLGFWVAADHVDVATGELRPDGESLPVVGANPIFGAAPLVITAYAPLQAALVLPDIQVQTGGVTYYRVYAAARAGAGALPGGPAVAPIVTQSAELLEFKTDTPP